MTSSATLRRLQAARTESVKADAARDLLAEKLGDACLTAADEFHNGNPGQAMKLVMAIAGQREDLLTAMADCGTRAQAVLSLARSVAGGKEADA